MEPHIRLGATRAEFEQAARERQIPLEVESHRGDWGEYTSVPLDGSMRGERLQLHFYDNGELQWAGIINHAGETKKCLLAVDKR